MRFTRAIIALAVVGLLQASVAQADIAPSPKDLPPGKNTAGLSVKIDSTKDMSFLRIPRSALREAGLEMREQKNAKPSAWNPGPTRSIVAAMALSLGIAGVFLTRKKRAAAITVALVAAGVVGTIGAQAWGNAAPMPLPAEKGLSGGFDGSVVIEIVDDEGGEVKLTIGTKPLPKYHRPLPPGSEAPNPKQKRI